MSPRSWTELFFLDEATAFVTGRRPCFELPSGRGQGLSSGLSAPQRQ
jgi:hypothetical protein